MQVTWLREDDDATCAASPPLPCPNCFYTDTGIGRQMLIQKNGLSDVYSTPCSQGDAIAELSGCTTIIVDGKRSIGNGACVNDGYCYVHIDYPLEGWIINYQCEANVSPTAASHRVSSQRLSPVSPRPPATVACDMSRQVLSLPCTSSPTPPTLLPPSGSGAVPVCKRG